MDCPNYEDLANKIAGFVTPEALHESRDAMKKWATDYIASGTQDSVRPMLDVESVDMCTTKKERTLMALCVDFNTHDEKHGAMRAIGQRLYTEKKMPICLSFISEAWMSKNPQGIQPILDPNRKEIVMIHSMNIMRQTAASMAMITRGTGNVISIADWIDMDNSRAFLLEALFDGYFQAGMSERFGETAQ